MIGSPEDEINQCMLSDQFRLRKKLQKISFMQDAVFRQEQLKGLEAEIANSVQRRELRARNLPKISYPDLPIVTERETLISAIKENPVIIVAGETGSGKTTQLPKLCLEAGLGIKGMIGHTQPRRIAARAVASRIASELNVPMGHAVGYKVRFSDQTSPESYIKIMTDGILLTETQTDRWLQQYDCLIIDEAHERSLNIDFLLGYIKNLMTKRKDLKVIVTSATIDVARFSQFFNHAPIIEVQGRSYPVELKYLGENSEDPLQSVINAVETACEQGQGDILIFQSGEKEIKEVIEALSAQNIKNVRILPLYARQSVSDQQKVFQTGGSRKIIVSTNVAETSITVPNIRFVIDSGLARVSRYNYRNKLQRLPIEPISQASADQRKGRCGRVGPGICYRLYTQEDFQLRPEFTEPEILRTNLAGVILRMLSLGLKDIHSFPFIDPPDMRFIKDGYTLLERLQAVDNEKRITLLGKQLANIPIEPKLGRIILAANQYGALREILIIVSGLSIVDPRERPKDSPKALERHAQFVHEHSDFMSYLNLWEFVFSHKKSLSSQQFKKLCRDNYLSFLRICEWFDVHAQLQEIANELNFKVNQVQADYVQIHKAILTGFIDTIGVKDESKEYIGARNIKFHIHPSSILFKKMPAWIVSGEIVHTTKVYARINAKIEPLWIEEVVPSLLKKQYFEPFFDESKGAVYAFEKVSLFGIDLIARRRALFEKHAPSMAREIFIRQGLVHQTAKIAFPFYQKNQQTIDSLIKMENRIRRKLILLDEERIFQFYNEHLPSHICSVRALEAYLKERNDSFLVFSLQQISATLVSEELFTDFPSEMLIKEQQCGLEYVFDLGADNDGVTAIVPIELLKILKDADFTWLIPGLLEDKITFYFKALPKRLRSFLSPLPLHVQQAKNNLSPNEATFEEALVKYLQETVNVSVSPSIWESMTLPSYLTMHFKIIDKESKVLAVGDDLKQLYQQLKEKFTQVFKGEHTLEKENILEWNFNDLPRECQVKKNKLAFTYYPALVDFNQAVKIQLFETKEQADYLHTYGLARMYLLHLAEPIKFFKKNIPNNQKKLLQKLYAPFGDYEQLINELLIATSMELFVKDNENVREKALFEQQLAKNRSQFLQNLNQLLGVLVQVLTLHSTIQDSIKEPLYQQSAFKPGIEDITQQLAQLFPKHFIMNTFAFWLKRYLIYLKAIDQRLDKLTRFPKKDEDMLKDVHAVQKAYKSQLSKKVKPHLSMMDPLNLFRWKIEELRVSLFAQTLGTLEPVSKVRLLKVLEKLS